MTDLDDDPLFPAWGIVTPTYWSGDSAIDETETTSETTRPSPATSVPPLPEHAPAGAAPPTGNGPTDLRAQVSAALTRGETETALRLATELDAQVTAACGELHSATADARELLGWAVWSGGDPATAARWYLHTTGLHAQLTTPTGEKTLASLRRAIAAWDELDDRERQTLADEVLTVVARTSGPDSRLWRHVYARMPAETS